MRIKRDKLLESILEVMSNPPVRELQGIKYQAWKGLERKQAIEIAKSIKIWHKYEIKKAIEKKCKRCSFKHLIEETEYE